MIRPRIGLIFPGALTKEGLKNMSKGILPKTAQILAQRKELERIIENVKHTLRVELEKIEQFEQDNNLDGIDGVFEQVLTDISCDRVDFEELMEVWIEDEKEEIKE